MLFSNISVVLTFSGGTLPIVQEIGAFFYSGAPSFGIFAILVVFIPFFCLNDKWAKVSTLLIFLAILFSNDRGPIIVLALLTFMIFPLLFSKTRLIILYIFLFCLLLSLFKFEIEPARLKLLLEFFKVISREGISLENVFSVAQNKKYSFGAYLIKWDLIITNWFTYENILGVLFGTGFGVTHQIVAQFTDGVVGRPHNVALEILLTFGVVGSLYFLYLLAFIIKTYKQHSLLILSIFIPVLNFTVYSFNILLLLLISILIMKDLHYQSKNKKAVDCFF